MIGDGRDRKRRAGGRAGGQEGKLLVVRMARVLSAGGRWPGVGAVEVSVDQSVYAFQSRCQHIVAAGVSKKT